MRDLMTVYGWEHPFQPMGVKDANAKTDKLFADDNYVAELKRDGNRYVCIDGRLFSRKLSENKKKPETFGMPVEKTGNVPHLAEFFERFGSCGIITDGEVYYPKKKSNHVTKVMGCDAWKARMRQGFGHFGTDDAGNLLWSDTEPGDWLGEVRKLDKDYDGAMHEPIHYMIFDLLHLNGQSLIELPWVERRAMLDDWYEREVVGTEWEKCITISVPYEGESAKRALLDWAERNEEEGIVFKRKDAEYKPGGKKHENYWYRIKGKIYADVVVMGVEPPEVEHKGKASELPKWKYWEFTHGTRELSGSEEAYRIAAETDQAVRPISKNHYMGWIGSVVFGLWKENEDPASEAFGCMELVEAGTCSGMNESIRAQITDLMKTAPEEIIGQVIEISAMERTEKGLFRHPQFERYRDDKNSHDCLWAEEVEVSNE